MRVGLHADHIARQTEALCILRVRVVGLHAVVLIEEIAVGAEYSSRVIRLVCL